MSFDRGLAERLRKVLYVVPPSGGSGAEPPEGGTTNFIVSEKKMFGGLCFMVSGSMCCGIVGETLMARVGPDLYKECLSMPHAREMDFTGKPLKAMVCVDPGGVAEDEDLQAWVGRCLGFITSLPSK